MNKNTLLIVAVGTITGIGGYYSASQQLADQPTEKRQEQPQAKTPQKPQQTASTAAKPRKTSRKKLPRPRKTKEQIAALKKKWQNKVKEAAPAEAATEEPIDTGYLDTPEPVESYLSSSKEFRSAINAGMKEIIPEIRKCLLDWKAETPAFNGRVSFHIDIGKQGLQNIEIEENEEVPLMVAGCMGNIMYTGQWPATTDGDTSVIYPFALSLE